eukprot:TRINITY_DN31884_c0_g1_i1.p2 TRINITY_DN31884_c0_g1~~TRINITY_DN31884_c0_g1_i1.p2  ORF type:complete len:112 (+),score=6.64 TRINITY_DN31884_c0_g1_i1:475-810(+)
MVPVSPYPAVGNCVVPLTFPWAKVRKMAASHTLPAPPFPLPSGGPSSSSHAPPGRNAVFIPISRARAFAGSGGYGTVAFPPGDRFPQILYPNARQAGTLFHCLSHSHMQVE